MELEVSVNYRPITDIWILARPKVSSYGAYPNGFLERARALLGVDPYQAVLHICGGKVRNSPAKPRGFGPYDKTLDLDPTCSPDFLQSAMEPHPLNLSDTYSGRLWDALLADPPYTEEDTTHYTPGAKAFPLPSKILCNMLDVVKQGGRVGMLHYILPQPPRKNVRFVACIGVITGFNDRMRCFSVFEKE